MSVTSPQLVTVEYTGFYGHGLLFCVIRPINLNGLVVEKSESGRISKIVGHRMSSVCFRDLTGDEMKMYEDSVDLIWRTMMYK